MTLNWLSEHSVLNYLVIDCMRPHPQANHVPPKRIWSFIYESLELPVFEQRHLNACMYCANVFRFCVTCESFEQMMREISGENEVLAA